MTGADVSALIGLEVEISELDTVYRGIIVAACFDGKDFRVAVADGAGEVVEQLLVDVTIKLGLLTITERRLKCHARGHPGTTRTDSNA